MNDMSVRKKPEPQEPVKFDCFAYRDGDCMALEKRDCADCSFYKTQDQIVYERIRAKERFEQIRDDLRAVKP